MSWTTEHDLILCKEVLFTNPYTTKKKSQQRRSLWQLVSENLNSIEKPRFLVNKRAVRDHVQVLIDRFKRKEAQEARESGTNPVRTELDNAVEQIIAMECSADSEDIDGIGEKKEQDRAKAEEMRQKAMETFGKTKRNSDEAGKSVGGSTSKKRRSGGDTLVYLREKARQEESLRQEELKLKEAQYELERKRTEALETQLQMMRQQQQEQNRFLMILMDKIINK